MITDQEEKEFFDNEPTGNFSTSRRKARLTTSVSTMGKIPPQAIDLEEAVLGALMLEKDAYLTISEVLKAEMFYQEGHKKIFEAITNLFSNSDPIDILTVTTEMRRLGTLEMVGGGYYITNLTSRVSSGANIEFYANVILEKHMQREMIRISTQTIVDSYEDTGDIFDIIEKNQAEVSAVIGVNHNQQGSRIGDLMNDSLKDLGIVREDGLTGVGSGLKNVDKVTHGWQKSDLIIIAARPAMGKTAFVLQCARNAVMMYNSPVVVFSLEMSKIQLTNRLLSNEAEIHLDRILKRRVSQQEIITMRSKVSQLAKANLIIDDTPALNVFEFRAKCRRLKQMYDIQMIVVDYLQLMNGKTDSKGSNRDAEIGVITRCLKSVAKELDVPVLALSQLSREVEKRPGKRPMLSDLRESGNIEQDADQVWFLYRPEYYGITEDNNGKSLIGQCQLIGAKNRHGVCETIPLDFNGAFMRMRDWVEEIPVQSNSVHTQQTDDFSF